MHENYITLEAQHISLRRQCAFKHRTSRMLAIRADMVSNMNASCHLRQLIYCVVQPIGKRFGLIRPVLLAY